jgi:hypothetical protein
VTGQSAGKWDGSTGTMGAPKDRAMRVSGVGCAGPTQVTDDRNGKIRQNGRRSSRTNLHKPAPFVALTPKILDSSKLSSPHEQAQRLVLRSAITSSPLVSQLQLSEVIKPTQNATKLLLRCTTAPSPAFSLLSNPNNTHNHSNPPQPARTHLPPHLPVPTSIRTAQNPQTQTARGAQAPPNALDLSRATSPLNRKTEQGRDATRGERR